MDSALYDKNKKSRKLILYRREIFKNRKTGFLIFTTESGTILRNRATLGVMIFDSLSNKKD